MSAEELKKAKEETNPNAESMGNDRLGDSLHADDRVFSNPEVPSVPLDPRTGRDWNKLTVDQQMAQMEKYQEQKAAFEAWEKEREEKAA